MKSTNIFGLGVLIGVSASATAFAVPISSGGTFLLSSPAMAYQSPSSAPPGVWDLFTLLSNCRVNDAAGGPVPAYRFSSADSNTFTWSGNQLVSDLSFDPTPGDPLNNDSTAEAIFDGSGTLSIFGKLRNSANVILPEFVGGPGLILQATVSSFHLRETGITDNKLHSIASGPGVNIQFTPTGGYLYDTATVVQLRGTYNFAMTAALVEPTVGGNLDNFGVDLKSTSSLLMSYTPEPASILLLSVGLLAIKRRRHCS